MMETRKPPGSNVVRLRRNGEPSTEERERLASTIFAEQDEIGTFSRGNLVPPVAAPPHAETEPPAAPDPFFDHLQAGIREETETETESVDGDSDATDAFFDRLGSQSPAEMSESLTPPLAVAAMPGSASVPSESAAKGRRQRRRPSSPSGLASLAPRLSTFRVRVLRAPLLGALGALIVAGVALAAITGTASRHSSAARRPTTEARAASRTRPLLTLPTHPGGAARLASDARRAQIRRRLAYRDDRRRASKPDVVLAADRRAKSATSASSVAAAPVEQPATQTVPPSPVASQPATQTPVAQSAAGSSAGTSSGEGSRPAFGANGVLGPGHSPNG
jgi:hypothetical protein